MKTVNINGNVYAIHVAEVAEYLKLSNISIYKMIDAGIIQTIKLKNEHFMGLESIEKRREKMVDNGKLSPLD